MTLGQRRHRPHLRGIDGLTFDGLAFDGLAIDGLGIDGRLFVGLRLVGFDWLCLGTKD
jgi:hypothetical protein